MENTEIFKSQSVVYFKTGKFLLIIAMLCNLGLSLLLFALMILKFGVLVHALAFFYAVLSIKLLLFMQ